MTKTIRFICGIVVLFFAIGCGGGGGGTEDSDNGGNREAAVMSGSWSGTVEMNLNGEEDQQLVLVQNGINLSGHFEGPGGQSDNVSGSIDESSVSLNVIFGQGDTILKFHYDGSLNSGVYSGQFTLMVNEKIQDEGTFSFQKDDNTPAPKPQDVNMSGRWQGSMSTQRFSDSPLVLELEQNGSNITGDMTFENYHTSNVSGSASHSTVTISGIYPTETDAMLEFAFKGTVDADLYSGNIILYIGGEIDEQGGTFSVLKDGGVQPNPAQSRYEVEAGSCFKLATGKETPSPCEKTSDIYFWGVDPYSDRDIFCVQEGTFPDLASVPSDYSKCSWDNYIEGGLGLENTGVIVRDLSYQHHYAMRIIENQTPTITFEYEKID